MEKETHEGSIDVEEAALEAGFTSAAIEPENEVVVPQVDVVEPSKQEKKPDDQIVATAEEAEKPLTRAEMQIAIEGLTQRLAKVHDTASGQIGNLQQKIEQIRTAGSGLSPKAKERLSADFPELADILFSGVPDAPVIPAAQVVKDQSPSIDIDKVVNSAKESATQAMELRLLGRDHKDWETVVVSPEFKTWTATIPVAEQQQLANSWDADFVSSKITEFKNFVQAKTQKDTALAEKNAELKKRLESAIQPRGVSSNAQSYNVDDEEAAMEEGFRNG